MTLPLDGLPLAVAVTASLVALAVVAHAWLAVRPGATGRAGELDLVEASGRGVDAVAGRRDSEAAGDERDAGAAAARDPDRAAEERGADAAGAEPDFDAADREREFDTAVGGRHFSSAGGARRPDAAGEGEPGASAGDEPSAGALLADHDQVDWIEVEADLSAARDADAPADDLTGREAVGRSDLEADARADLEAIVAADCGRSLPAGIERPPGRAAARRLVASTLAMAGLVLLASALAGQPGAAAIVAALVPLAGLPALFPKRSWAERGASGPIAIAALAAAVGGALPVMADFHQSVLPDPALARAALALLVLNVCLVGAIVPGHLWSLGLADRVPTAGLAALLGLGDLAALAVLVAALDTYPWLLGVVGARPLLVAVGAAGLALALVGLLGERGPVRAVLLVGQVPAAAAWLALASGASGGSQAAVALLLGRALGLAVALLALDALERQPPLSWRVPHRRRLLGPAQVALWIGLGSLIGLPPTAGFLATRSALEALASERPELALSVLAAMGLALLGARRVPLALLIAPAERPTSGAGQPGWRSAAAPLTLGVATLALGLAGGALLDALRAAGWLGRG